MKIYLLLIYLLPLNSIAQLFEQNFSVSDNFKDYFHISQPTNNQFTKIDSTGVGFDIRIQSQKLKLHKKTSNEGKGGFVRNVDFNPTPRVMEYKFRIKVDSNNQLATTAGLFQVGDRFHNGVSFENNSEVFARLGITISANTGKFYYRNINSAQNSNIFSGEILTTWIINSTNSKYYYINPKGVIDSVAQKRSDVWGNTSLAFNDITCVTESVPMNNLKFQFIYGTGIIFFDDFSIRELDAPLPINFIEIAAKCLQEAVLLEWKVAENDNESHFFIERAKIDRNKNVFFEPIAIVSKNDFTNQLINHYEFKDHNPMYGTAYYRVVGVDLRGEKRYSEVLPVNYEKNNSLNLTIKMLSTERYLELKACFGNTKKKWIKIIDVSGKTLLYQGFYASEDCYSIDFYPNNLSPSLYLIQISDGLDVLTRKIIF